MAKLNQAQLETDMLAEAPFNYGVLVGKWELDQTQRMQLDRTIQKLRKAGKITMTRRGGVVWWEKAPLKDASLDK